MKKILICLMVVIIISSLFCTSVYAEEVVNTAESTELLTQISNTLTAIQYTLLFMVFIHFVEKWFKIAMDLNKNSGRVN